MERFHTDSLPTSCKHSDGERIFVKKSFTWKERAQVLTDQQPEVPSLSPPPSSGHFLSSAPTCSQRDLDAGKRKRGWDKIFVGQTPSLYRQVPLPLFCSLALFVTCPIATIDTRKHPHLISQVPLYFLWNLGCICRYRSWLRLDSLSSFWLPLVSPRTTLPFG